MLFKLDYDQNIKKQLDEKGVYLVEGDDEYRRLYMYIRKLKDYELISNQCFSKAIDNLTKKIEERAIHIPGRVRHDN